MARFKAGDKIRRLASAGSWFGVEPGQVVTVLKCDKAWLMLEHYGSGFDSKNFELVVDDNFCTPKELFSTLTIFIRALLAEPPVRVGDVYRTTDGYARIILAIHDNYLWISDDMSAPFTYSTNALSAYTLVKRGPVV